MSRPNGLAPAFPRGRAACALLLGALLLPGVCAYAQQELPAAPDAAIDELADAPTAVPPPPDTHATRQAPTELMTLAAREPQTFIGKTLILHDGASSTTVGQVLDVRERLQDEELYLVVDATLYFNTAVTYAVAVRDLDRIEDANLIIPERPGMHLHGLDYYPDDYADIEVTAPTAADQ